jgi:O-antigen/teichoic acid export membrane protein
VGTVHIAGFPLGLAMSILLARSLGPEQFGQYALLSVVIGFLVLPASGGVSTLLTREIASYASKGDWRACTGIVRFATKFVLFASAVLGVGLFGIFSVGEWHSGYDDLAILAGLILLIVRSLENVTTGILRGFGRVSWVELMVRVLAPALSVTALLVAVTLGDLNLVRTLFILAVVAFVSLCINATYVMINKPIQMSGVTPVYYVSAWRRALLPFTSIAIVSMLNSELSTLLLGIMNSEEAVAGLRIASRAALLVALPLGLVNVVIAPRVAAIAWKTEKGNLQLQALARASTISALAVALPVALLLIWLGKPLLATLYGDEYVVLAYPSLVVLVAGQVFNVAMGSVGTLLSMTGYEKGTLIGQFCGFLTLVVISLLLIPKYGQFGAALAVTTSLFIWNIVMASMVYKKLAVRPGPL